LAVHGPSDDDIKVAAANGNEEALAMLPALLESEQAALAWWALALQDVSQLPDLAGSALTFVLDVEHTHRESHVVIRLGEQLVWREPLSLGDRPRFYELKRLLKKKYNGALREPPTDEGCGAGAGRPGHTNEAQHHVNVTPRSRSTCYAAPMLVVDPWDWLTEEGELLREKPRLYRRMLRIARIIEYGGELQKNQTRETLLECKRRPVGKPCLGLMWVMKTMDDGILASCVVCKTDEALVHNWQKTEWAEGMMPAVDLGGPLVH
jgi:hypothetical protein